MNEMTRLDRVISWLSPRWGAERLAFRQALELSHRGGVATRTDRQWSRDWSYTGGTTSSRTGMGNMRDRARKADRDNAIARSILNTETDNVVAEGFTLQAKTADGEFNRMVEDAFWKWGERADIRGMKSWGEFQRMLYRTVRRDGDGGVVLADIGGESKLQMVPGDLICNPDTGAARTTYDGIEINTYGRPIRFHLLSQDESGKRTFTPVTASNFLYITHTTEALQLRGESCFAQVFPLLDQIDGYVDAVVMAARMGAIFGLIFKESNGAKQFAGLPQLANSNGNQQKAITLENGMVKYIGQADDVVQVNATQPMSQTPDFIAAMLRQIGLPFDMPLELVLKDFSRVNFSSARAAFLNYYRSARCKQQAFVSHLDRIYQWWLSREVAKGAIEVPAAIRETYWDHEFMPRGWEWVDPVSEAQAALLEINMGINSPQRVAAKLGRDLGELMTENIAAREAFDEADIDFPRSTYIQQNQPLPTSPAMPAGDGVTPDGEPIETSDQPEAGDSGGNQQDGNADQSA